MVLGQSGCIQERCACSSTSRIWPNPQHLRVGTHANPCPRELWLYHAWKCRVFLPLGHCQILLCRLGSLQGGVLVAPYRKHVPCFGGNGFFDMTGMAHRLAGVVCSPTAAATWVVVVQACVGTALYECRLVLLGMSGGCVKAVLATRLFRPRSLNQQTVRLHCLGFASGSACSLLCLVVSVCLQAPVRVLVQRACCTFGLFGLSAVCFQHVSGNVSDLALCPNVPGARYLHESGSTAACLCHADCTACLTCTMRYPAFAVE